MTHPWCTSLAQKLTTVRELKGLSIREHAKYLGISAATLSRIERGHSCDLSVLSKICERTGLPVDVLLGVSRKSRRRPRGDS